MPALRPRSGTGLAESLVVLVLAGLMMAAVGRGLSQHLRQRRERDNQARADEIVQVVRDVMRAELGHSEPVPQLLGDTAVQLASTRLAAVACELVAGRLTLPASVVSWSTPRAGDSLAIIDTLTRAEWRTAIIAAGTQRANARCPAGGTRLTLAALPPPSISLLLPARVWRLVRYTTYQASDGDWWLGERSCTTSCAAAQPIVGPLLPPNQGGFHVALVPGPDGRPVALDLSARAAVGGRSAAMWARLPLAVFP